MKKIERENLELVALALANGGAIEDELGAAEAVFDWLGWPVKVEWRIECAAYGEEPHRLHSWAKPSEAAARKACESNDHDPVLLAAASYRAACVPFRIRCRLILEREVPRHPPELETG